MTILDNLEEIKKIDTANVLGSIEKLGNQCQQAWNEAGKISFPEKYRQVKNIVFSGMGGSALGAYVVKSLFFNSLKFPFEIVNDYHLPVYVSSETLIILGTYSGTTEETLSCAKEALNKKACVTGFTTGGKLAEFFLENDLPGYIFKPNNNPSGQPRMGTGYSIYGLIAALNKLGIISAGKTSLEETRKSLNAGVKSFDVSIQFEKNEAKKIAKTWIDKIPVVVAAEHLTNVGRVIRNQLHETAKSFAAFHDLPELNHHLMEGLKNPEINKKILNFLFLNSALYSQKIQKRYAITKDVVSQNKIEISEFTPRSTDKIAQVFESIQLGAYISFYMAILYGIDPSKIPWVDYFKKQLAS